MTTQSIDEANTSLPPEARKSLIHSIRAIMYVAFACAYVSGVVLFIMLYSNYWAAGGFSLTIALILVRLWQHMLPTEKLYTMFPVASWQRALWQSFFFALMLGGVGVGLWLFARGLQKRQNWTGDSYFCSMTGIFMAAKWAFFLTLSIRDLRPDTIDEPTMDKVRDILGMPARESKCEKNSPFVYGEPDAMKDEPDQREL